jgi:3'-5' exoribonuclease
METNFYAKIDSINETTYETDTCSVITENNERITCRFPKDIVFIQNAVYNFEVEPITFKERQQYLVKEAIFIDDADITFERRNELMQCFYEFAPVDSNEVKKIVESYLGKLNNKAIKEIVMDLYNQFEDKFYLYPAATKFHHAYIGGLSYHTSTMLKLIDGFMTVYPFLNQDLLIAGILLHDIYKTTELTNYAGPEYSKEGKLLGHITMSVKGIEVVAQKLGYGGSEEALLLQHMVLSHHYYGNYGSPKKPMIPEALIVHFIDNIDSKLTVLEEVLAQTEKGEFTSPIAVADREKYYKSKL